MWGIYSCAYWIFISEIFTKDNYELDKIYLFTNIALGDLFKDSVETYNKRLGD